MKVVAVVGHHKSGKTTLIEALVKALKRYGRVGTVKHMPGHHVDHGDTHRHLMAGADVVVGIGLGQIVVTPDGSLESALEEMKTRGIDFVILEGFKSSRYPKIAIGGIDVPNKICDVHDVSDSTVNHLVRMILSL